MCGGCCPRACSVQGLSATADCRTGARFDTVDSDRTEDAPDADDDWADELMERALARSSGEPQPPDPDPADSYTQHPPPETPQDAPGASTAARQDAGSRPSLVTFEDLHGSSGSFPAPTADRSVEVVPQVPSPPPPDFPEATPDSMQQVDLGMPGTGLGAGKLILEWGSVIVGALVMALLVKAYLFQAFYIPSPSMEPTLVNGDRIIVNKLSYDLHQVNRGDVVVFKAPQGAVNGIEDLIKRVIALPGETISTEAGRVRIDGGLLLEPYLVSQDMTSGFSLPPGCLNPAGTPDTCLVPPGHVFVMGDNRSNSKDARFFGPIPEESILGRAFLRVWPLGDIGRL